MNKKLKYFIIFTIALIFVFFILYQYVMKSGGRNLQSENAEYVIKSTQLINEFSENADLASKKYTEKAIQINGLVTNIAKNQLILDGSIICQCALRPTVKIGQKIIVKGRFVGFDDLMSELKLDQCYLIQ